MSQLKPPPASAATPAARRDLDLIARMIRGGGSVLDLGCGDGTLLALLEQRKNVRGQGVEISWQGVQECVAKGLSVHHGNIDEGLGDFPDGSFDYVILSQTLQAVHHPDLVVREMLRVGRKGIVSFPNFGHWQVRWHLLSRGRMPVTPWLPYQWYDTPNIHFCTIADFRQFCADQGIAIVRAVYLDGDRPLRALPNLRARTALFAIERTSPPNPLP